MRSLKLIFFAISLFITSKGLSIVGGDLVNREDLEARSTVGLSNGCTGTLIEADIILTAAHCLVNINELSIIFGLSFSSGIRIQAESILIHPEYNGTASGGLSPDTPASEPIHDIALVKLSQISPTGFTPVEIGTGENLLKGSELILSGFGSTSAQGGGNGVLRTVKTVFNFYNTNALEIVFGPTQGKSACRGDSGGPMYIQDGNRLVLIGATSRGFPSLGACSGNGNYTDAGAHIDFINEGINLLRQEQR